MLITTAVVAFIFGAVIGFLAASFMYWYAKP